jgi:hypothetical protein
MSTSILKSILLCLEWFSVGAFLVMLTSLRDLSWFSMMTVTRPMLGRNSL